MATNKARIYVETFKWHTNEAPPRPIQSHWGGSISLLALDNLNILYTIQKKICFHLIHKELQRNCYYFSNSFKTIDAIWKIHMNCCHVSTCKLLPFWEQFWEFTSFLALMSKCDLHLLFLQFSLHSESYKFPCSFKNFKKPSRQMRKFTTSLALQKAFWNNTENLQIFLLFVS